MTLATSLPLIVNGVATSAAMMWPGGVGTFEVLGTFAGATVGLQFLGPDGATYMAYGSSTNLTSAGFAPFTLPQGLIKAVVTGGPPSGIYATAAVDATLIE